MLKKLLTIMLVGLLVFTSTISALAQTDSLNQEVDTMKIISDELVENTRTIVTSQGDLTSTIKIIYYDNGNSDLTVEYSNGTEYHKEIKRHTPKPEPVKRLNQESFLYSIASSANPFSGDDSWTFYDSYYDPYDIADWGVEVINYVGKAAAGAAILGIITASIPYKFFSSKSSQVIASGVIALILDKAIPTPSGDRYVKEYEFTYDSLVHGIYVKYYVNGYYVGDDDVIFATDND